MHSPSSVAQTYATFDLFCMVGVLTLLACIYYSLITRFYRLIIIIPDLA
jgi:hypothetical protein